MQVETKGRDWPAIFVKYEQSGLNQQDFCADEGLRFVEFKYHRTKYLKQKAKAPGFKPLRVSGSPSYELELTLPQGLCLKLKPGVSVDYVKRLLQAIR